jgi:hypothetical protein
MNKEIKILYNKEIKRFELTQTYENLIENIKKSFKQLEEKEILIKYQDDEMDYIAISSQFDLEQVLIFMENKNLQVLRGFIDVKDQIAREENSCLKDKFVNQDKEVGNNYLKEEKKEITEIKKEENKEEIQSTNVIARSLKLTESFVNVTNKENEERNIIQNNNNINAISKEVFNESHNPSILIPEKSLPSIDGLEIIKSLLVHPVIEQSLNKPTKEEICTRGSIKETDKDVCEDNKKNNHNHKLEKKLKKEKKAILKEKRFQERFNMTKNLIDNQTIELKNFFSKLIEEKFAELKSSMQKENSEKKPFSFNELLIESSQQYSYKNQQINITVHKINCKGCHVKEIVGNRYKCCVCEDYNLCENCENLLGLKHGHPFLKLREDIKGLDKKIAKEENKKIEEKIVKNEVISSKCISENRGEFNCGNKEVIIKVTLQNNGRTDWPNSLSLRNIDGISGETIRLNKTIKSGETICFDVKLLTGQLVQGDYNSRWALYDEDKSLQIGTSVDLKFKMMKNQVINSNPNNNYRFKHMLKDMKEIYDLKSISEIKILDALEKSNGKMEDALGYLF